MSEQSTDERAAQEASYRRGWQQGAVETERILLQLMELGYDRRKIRQLLAIYHDHMVSQWRSSGNLEQKEPFPPFDIERIEAIAAAHRGYDWLLNEA